MAAAYLQYLVDEKQEADPSFHNWLAELYIEDTLSARHRNDDGEPRRTGAPKYSCPLYIGSRKRAYDGLLAFLDNSTHYDVDRVFIHLPMDGQ